MSSWGRSHDLRDEFDQLRPRFKMKSATCGDVLNASCTKQSVLDIRLMEVHDESTVRGERAG
jgi:hypothetical protein